jgi:hypothetical protein
MKNMMAIAYMHAFAFYNLTTDLLIPSSSFTSELHDEIIWDTIIIVPEVGISKPNGLVANKLQKYS